MILYLCSMTADPILMWSSSPDIFLCSRHICVPCLQVIIGCEVPVQTSSYVLVLLVLPEMHGFFVESRWKPFSAFYTSHSSSRLWTAVLLSWHPLGSSHLLSLLSGLIISSLCSFCICTFYICFKNAQHILYHRDILYIWEISLFYFYFFSF